MLALYLGYARIAKNAKKDAVKVPDGSDDTVNTDQEWIKQDTAPKLKIKESANIGGDHSGTFAFVRPSDYNKAKVSILVRTYFKTAS